MYTTGSILYGVINLSESYLSGTPVWVYHIDIDTSSNLAVPQLLRGLVGQHYSVVKGNFDHYNFVEADSDLTGTFDQQPHTVRLYYRRKAWAEVEDIDMYLQFNAPTQVYDYINGVKRQTVYPAGMVLRTFKRVATDDGKFWYEIGPDQWVLYHLMSIVSNPFDQPKPEVTGDIEAMEELTNVKGSIDYVEGEMIQVYDKPYGKIVNELKHDTKVNLIGRMTDKNGVTWYEVEDKGFVNGSYIKIN